eukprot:4234582-Amphidinium_carterae.1
MTTYNQWRTIESTTRSGRTRTRILGTWMTHTAMNKHETDNYDGMNEFDHDFKDQKRHYERKTTKT